MTQVKMLEAKTDLSKLVKMLETKQEEIIYLARNGKPIARMTLIPKKSISKRIGIPEFSFLLRRKGYFHSNNQEAAAKSISHTGYGENI
ncbi:hypothetical protein AALB16_12805 [Lachnospiraceae bacterium 62-35]